MAYIGNEPGNASQRVVTEEVISGSAKSDFYPVGGYTLGYVDVLINGIEVDSSDFTAANGTLVHLNSPAQVGDTVKIKCFIPRGLSDGYTKAEALAKFIGKDSDTGAAKLPAGTTAQRPSAPDGSEIRKNTTTGYIEYFDPSAQQWIGIGAFQASGGSESTYTSGGSTYKVHTFNSSSVLNVLAGAKAVDVLIVAGGGAGGTNAGGGGGAGGLIYQTNVSLIQGTYSVVVGAGGANGGADGSPTGSGNNSSFFGYTAIGGGGGINSNGKASSGGSGGGSSVSQTGGSGTSGQGNKGGDGNGQDGYERAAGGGGGAGAAGQNVVNSSTGGVGGNGLQVSISGTPTYYAGGGGGAAHQGGLVRSGGLGGGGNSGISNSNSGGTAGNPGTANTGGGGGAGSGGGLVGGTGGSGVVIVRYQIA